MSNSCSSHDVEGTACSSQSPLPTPVPPVHNQLQELLPPLITVSTWQAGRALSELPPHQRTERGCSVPRVAAHLQPHKQPKPASTAGAG